MKKILFACFVCISTRTPAMNSPEVNQDNKILYDSIHAIEIGGTVPPLSFTNITNSSLKHIHIPDQSGKITILDFWATWCGACISAMPEKNKLQDQFKDQVQFLLVDYETKQRVDDFFSKTKKLRGMDLGLPSLYGDTILDQYFPHFYIPHFVWIDPSGKVIAITNSEEVSADNIQKAIHSNLFALDVKTDRVQMDLSQPFFNESVSKPLYKNEGTYGPNKLQFRSVLTKYIDSIGSGTAFYTGRIIGKNNSILNLIACSYSYSFSDHLAPVFLNRILLEVAHPEQYRAPTEKSQIKEWMQSNSYVYDLTFPDYYDGLKLADGPDSIRKYACEVMKKDIEKFSGLHTSLQNRKVVCLVLKCFDSSKVNADTDFGPTQEFPGHLGGVFNYPNMEYLMRTLLLAFQYGPPLVDETNYHGKVNIKIEATLTDVDAVNRELKKFGLEVVREQQTIPMLVISDH